MKKQTVLEPPRCYEMNHAGFKRVGIVSKRGLKAMIDNEVPWGQWFFCPIWKNDVEAWFRD
jgi:hypothetical protein